MFEELINELQERYELEDDWITRMELSGEIEDLKVRMGTVLPPKPPESPYMCEGCSA